VAVGVPAAYDAVARQYDRQLGGELGGKPLDRALLTAFLDLVDVGTVVDVGCGPGHITRFLAQRHADVLGLDLSPGMIEVAREAAPGLAFVVASMLALPAADASWAGVLALYSIIHMTADERTTAYREFGRVLRPGGRLLLAFHVDSPEFAAGEVTHVTSFLGESVELDGYFLAPSDVVAQLQSSGFSLAATVERRPNPEGEYPSRRCYLLAQRR
jgi:ubiquinone/menaquinone biosynthesis C-methylase UbiE